MDVKLRQADGTFGKTYLKFHEESTPEWDWELDATHNSSGNCEKPRGLHYLENGHEFTSIAWVALADASIPCQVRSGSRGTVCIQHGRGRSLPEGFCAVFEDLETGEVAALEVIHCCGA